jgi:hypothetical protein
MARTAATHKLHDINDLHVYVMQSPVVQGRRTAAFGLAEAPLDAAALRFRRAMTTHRHNATRAPSSVPRHSPTSLSAGATTKMSNPASQMKRVLRPEERGSECQLGNLGTLIRKSAGRPENGASGAPSRAPTLARRTPALHSCGRALPGRTHSSGPSSVPPDSSASLSAVSSKNVRRTAASDK